MHTVSLVDPTGTVQLAVPSGWSVVDDVGAVLCEAPLAQADITGRRCAAWIRVEPGDRGSLVPRVTASGHRPDLLSMTQGIVADTFAGDPTTVLIDAHRCLVRTSGQRGHTEGVRIDMAHHDMTTAMVTTTILVDGGQGIVRVTASTPVAHHGALGDVVEQALASLQVVGDQPAQAPDLSRLDPGCWELRGYRFPPVSLDAVAFDVFVRGSHKISPRWRPPAQSAGLVEASGVATPMGHYVRRAVSRPDRRVVLQIWDTNGPMRAQVCVDVLDRRAVLRSSSPAHIAVLEPFLATKLAQGSGTFAFEVQDMAAVPARLAAWLGLGLAGPQRGFLLGPGQIAVGTVLRAGAPGTPVLDAPFTLDPSDLGPARLWARLVSQLA